MSEKNDDSIERFFRKAANQSDSSHLEEDWRKMEQMLDERFPAGLAAGSKGLLYTRVAVSATVVAMLVAAVILFRPAGLRVGEDGSADQQQAAAREIPKQNAPQHEVTVDGPVTAADLPSADESEPADVLRSKSGMHPVTHPNADQRNRVYRQRPLETEPIGEASKRLTEKDIDGPGSEGPQIADASESRRDKAKENTMIREEGGAEEMGEEPVEAIKLTETEEEENTGNPDPEDDKQGPLIRPSRWNVTLVLAPDFSTTSLRRYTTPGRAFGLMIGYRLGSRLTISAGAVKSFKQYQGRGDEYHPPEGYWMYTTNGRVPDLIDGQCNILEIPVAVQFDLLQGQKHRFFASAGVSSYLMLDESYDYTFWTPNPGAHTGWASNEDSSYPGAVGSFSVGYERHLSAKISLAVEPYVKIPFAGIGWTDIRLFTAGAYVNLRYRFGRPTLIEQPLNDR